MKGSDGQPIAIPFPPDEVRKVEDELLEMLRGEAEGGGVGDGGVGDADGGGDGSQKRSSPGELQLLPFHLHSL